MSRYIDADALIEQLKSSSAYNDYEWSMYADGFIEDIENAPSIDIVFCKECGWIRYCETEELDLYLDCDKPDGGGIPRNEDWFCADGERREP